MAYKFFKQQKIELLQKDLFDKNVRIQTQKVDLFLKTETSANGRDGFENSKEENIRRMKVKIRNRKRSFRKRNK